MPDHGLAAARAPQHTAVLAGCCGQIDEHVLTFQLRLRAGGASIVVMFPASSRLTELAADDLRVQPVVDSATSTVRFVPRLLPLSPHAYNACACRREGLEGIGDPELFHRSSAPRDWPPAPDAGARPREAPRKENPAKRKAFLCYGSHIK